MSVARSGQLNRGSWQLTCRFLLEITPAGATGASHRLWSVKLAADWVITPAGALARAWVSERDGIIDWIGPAGDRHAPPGEVVDLGHGVLMPGLVNAHCHLELTHLAGAIGGEGGFVPWVEKLVASRPGFTDAEVDAGISRGIAEAIATGTVAIADISNTLRSVLPLAASPLRAIVLFELLAWDPAASEKVLGDAARRLAEAGGPRPAPRVEIRIAAHAPHSVSPELMRGLARAGGPAAIHLAESREESAFLSAGAGDWGAFLERRGLGHVGFDGTGRSPVAYLDTLGALNRGTLCAHCVQIDSEDCRLLAERGAVAVLCPRSNRTLGVGRAPVADLLAAGVTCALGTDSLASAPSLDLLQEATALQRDWPQVPAERIIAMATADGARALGLTDVGAIAVGRSAALAFAAGPSRIADPYAFLVSGDATAAPVAHR
jgi:cytosine/adenosine deaminase-related metal-dependent hydrolase